MMKPNASLPPDFGTQFVKNCPDGILTFDKDCRYTSWNLAMEKITGVKAEVVLGQKAFILFPFLKEKGQDLYFLKALEGESNVAPLRPFYVTISQKSIFVESHFAPLKNAQQEIIGGISIVRDVSARALQEANDQMFRVIAESIPHIVWVTDDQSQVSYFNKRWYEYTGLDTDSHPQDSLALVHEEDRQTIILASDDSRATGKPFQAEYRLKGKAGNYRWFLAKGITVLGIDGKLLRGLGTATDIHDQKLAMQSALEANQRFRSLVEQTPFAFQLYDLEGYCLYANPAWENIWQASRDELRGYNILTDENAYKNGLIGQIQEAFQGKPLVLPDFYYDPVLSKKPGRGRWIRTYFFPVSDALGKFIQVASVLEDVTSQNSLRDRQQFLDSATKVLSQTLEIDAILSGIADLCVGNLADICIIDLFEADGTSLRRVKVAASDRIKPEWLEAMRKFPPSTAFPHHPCMQALSKMKTVVIQDFNADWMRRSETAPAFRNLMIEAGSKSVVAIPLIARNRAIGVLTVICIERSGRFFAQEEIDLVQELGERTAIAIDNASLYQESKQAVLARDTFLSIASHELKTPLTTLQLQLKFIQRQVHQENRLDETTGKLIPLVEETQHGIKRITRLVDDMLDISKIASGKFAILPESLDLSRLATEVCARLKALAGEGASVIRVESNGPLYGEWDGLRLEQVLTNLITNAYRYGEKSEISVRIWESDDHAYLSVKDRGRGISEADQARIFERFERAVSEYEVAGFGLGLYIAREIVKLHQGSIGLESSLGIGSLFTVKLPLSFFEVEAEEEERT